MTVVKFGRVVDLVTAKSGGRDFCIGLEAIESETGQLVAEPATDFGGDGIDFEPGDVLFGKLRPYLAKAWLADRPGAAVGDFHVYRPLAGLTPEYLRYALLARNFLDPVISSVYGAKMPRAGWDFIRNVDVFLPPLTEQQLIADYLDRETARIDTLIEEQERLIEMLRERRVSVISNVFADKSFDSRLQHACIDVVDCPHTTPEASDEGPFEAVRTASVRDGKYRPGNGIRVSSDTWLERISGGAPALGDVLFTREAPAGEACMVPSTEICLGQRMVLLRVQPTAAIGEFLLWQIYSDRVQDYFRLSANGSTVSNVRLPVLRATPLWLPSLDKQRRIAAHLDEQTAKIDELIAETERFIELSRERRSALITAAVTGQIDVRGEAA